MPNYTLQKLDLANLEQVQRVLFQMSPDKLVRVIAIVDSMKGEIRKRLEIRDALENFALSKGVTLKSLSVTKTKVDLTLLR